MPQLSYSNKMIYKFEDIENKEKLLNKMRHASYLNRYGQVKQTCGFKSG